MKRVLDHDPFTGITTTFESDGDGKFRLTESQDVQHILDHNQRMANGDSGGWTKSRDMRYVGSIPLTIIHQWKVEKGIDVFNKDHWPAVRRLLNDSEWQKLRGAHWNV